MSYQIDYKLLKIEFMLIRKYVTIISKSGSKVLNSIDDVTVDSRKFSDYIFNDAYDDGKKAIFNSYGYGKSNSDELASLYQKQAYEQFNSGNYVSKGNNGYGEVISIEINVPGIGSASGKSGKFITGWMVNPDGTIKLTTPFAGFGK